MNNIAHIRQARALSMQDLADRVGTDASTISKLEKGKTKLTDQWMRRLAKGLEVEPAALISEAPLASQPRTEISASATSRRQIPVLGTAAGSHLSGAIQFSEGVAINHVDAPPMLANATGIYGLYVEGESMWPMFKHGSIILVTPHKPPRNGDAVIVQEVDTDGATIKATLGVLDHLNHETLKIRKLNPSAIVEFKRKYVKDLHKVLDFDDILGG